MIRTGVAPKVRAASTNSRFLNCRILPRNARAEPIHPEMASATIREKALPPMTIKIKIM